MNSAIPKIFKAGKSRRGGLRGALWHDRISLLHRRAGQATDRSPEEGKDQHGKAMLPVLRAGPRNPTGLASNRGSTIVGLQR